MAIYWQAVGCIVFYKHQLYSIKEKSKCTSMNFRQIKLIISSHDKKIQGWEVLMQWFKNDS